MYDELIKRLRTCAELHGECALCLYQGNGCDAMPETPLVQAADAIEELSKPRWIPVTERLPEVNERVMVCVKNCGELWIYDATRWNGEHWETEMEACYDYWKEIDEPVTHWMPLPELPKEVNNG